VRPSDHASPTLLRSLDLKALSAGLFNTVVGAGIFVLSGDAAAQFAGPGVVLSFAIAGLAAATAALCYAELASMIPVTGSQVKCHAALVVLADGARSADVRPP